MSQLGPKVGVIESRQVTEFVPEADVLKRYGELIVGFGANVQPGQVVAITTEEGKGPLTLAVTRAAYQAGAKYVEHYFDTPLARRIRAQLTAKPDDLEFEMKWPGERVRELADLPETGANVALVGNMITGLMDDVDPERADKVRPPGGRAILEAINKQTVNWTVAAYPTEAWATQVYPDLPAAEAHQKLWEEVFSICRLDEADPVASWQQRHNHLIKIAKRLAGRNFAALHFQGPGPDNTDLKVGLFQNSSWIAGRMETVSGVGYVPNIPTEEIYTTPDPANVNGRVKASKDFELQGSGITISGFTAVFEQGRATKVDATAGAEAMRRHIEPSEKDKESNRLGEVALVDGDSRVANSNTSLFGLTLLDENAAPHLAFGDAAYRGLTVKDADNKLTNHSGIHTDFMIGSPEVRVTGITSDGERVPVLIDGKWAI